MELSGEKDGYDKASPRLSGCTRGFLSLILAKEQDDDDDDDDKADGDLGKSRRSRTWPGKICFSLGIARGESPENNIVSAIPHRRLERRKARKCLRRVIEIKNCQVLVEHGKAIEMRISHSTYTLTYYCY